MYMLITLCTVSVKILNNVAANNIKEASLFGPSDELAGEVLESSPK